MIHDISQVTGSSPAEAASLLEELVEQLPEEGRLHESYSGADFQLKTPPFDMFRYYNAGKFASGYFWNSKL
jgi:hypothetical protein